MQPSASATRCEDWGFVAALNEWEETALRDSPGYDLISRSAERRRRDLAGRILQELDSFGGIDFDERVPLEVYAALADLHREDCGGKSGETSSRAPSPPPRNPPTR